MEEFDDAPELSEDDLRLGPDHLQALGAISYHYAALASGVSKCIGKLVSTDATVGDILCARGYLATLLDVLACLVRYRYGDSQLASEVSDAIALADSASKDRNRIVHSVWLINIRPKDGYSVHHGCLKMTRSRSSGIRYHGGEIKLSDLEAIGRDLETAANLMWNLESKLDCDAVADPDWWMRLLDDDVDGDKTGTDQGAV